MFNPFKKSGLTNDQKGTCEYYFEDEPDKNISEIAKEMNVDPNFVKSHKGVWKRSQPKTEKSEKPLTSELRKFVRMKEDVDNFQRVFGGGEDIGNTELDGAARLINSIVAAIENPNVQALGSKIHNVVETAKEKNKEQKTDGKTFMTKEEMINNHLKQLMPWKNQINAEEIKKQLDNLSPEQRESMCIMYESVDDLKVLGKGLEIEISDEDLKEILAKIHTKPEEKTEENNGGDNNDKD